MGENRLSGLRSFPTVCLDCELNPLSIKLVELLEKNFCKPLILSEKAEEWKRALSERGFKETVIQENDSSYLKNTNIDFLIYLDSIESEKDKLNIRERSTRSIEMAKRNSCKAIFIFDYFQKANNYKRTLSIKERILEDKDLYAGIIYVGDLLFAEKGKNSLNEKIFSNFLSVDLKKSTIFLPKRERLFLLNLDSLARSIIRNLFSLKAYGKSTALLSPTINTIIFEEKVLDSCNEFQIFQWDGSDIEVEVDEKINLPGDIDTEINRFLAFLREYLPEKKLSDILRKKDKSNTSQFMILKRSSDLKVEDGVGKKNGFKEKLGKSGNDKSFLRVNYKVVLVILIAFFLTPLIFQTISLVTFGVGKLFLLKLEFPLTTHFFQTSKSISLVTQKYSSYGSSAPLIGELFLQIGESAKLLEKASTIGIKGLNVTDNIIFLTQQFSRREKISNDQLSELYTNLDDLSNQISFFEAEMNTKLPGVKLTSKIVLGNLNIEKIKGNIINAKKLAEILPQFLGEVKPVTYLILFQDNGLLRPTGGVINKFSLITFSGGEITDSETHESNYLNGKLQGNIEPPQPLKKYVNENTWLFEDINWDPNFPTSASKAEWFLDKTIDKSVDGVFAINIDFLRDVFKNKNDYLMNSKSGSRKENHAELSDQELVERFFDDIEHLSYQNTIKYLALFVTGMESKDIQIFLNDNRSSRVLNEISWDGSFSYTGCQNNCYSDFVSMNEYGIGDVKSQEVKRKASLTISLEEKLIKRKMIYFLENPTDNTYSGYLRVFAPGDVGFGVTNVTQKNNRAEITPVLQGVRGYKEAGVFFEVFPGDTTVLNFTWEGGAGYTFDNDGHYDISWIKQSGTEPFAISIKLEKNKKIKLEATPAFSLTAEDYLGYNTDLSRDYFSRIFWTKN